MIEKIPPPRLLSELPEDLQRLIKSVTTDAADRLIPMMYSKMTANQELRKLCRVGAAGAGADKVRIPQDRQSAWPRYAADAACAGRRGDRVSRKGTRPLFAKAGTKFCFAQGAER